MKDCKHNPYEASKALPRAKRSHGKQWIVTIDGVARTVILNHSKMGMATSVYIEDELVFKHGDITTSMPSADIPLKYGASEILITIRDKFFGSEYSISLNGQLVDGPDHAAHSVQSDRNSWRLQSAVFMLLIAPILYFLLGSEWRVGAIRGDIVSLILFLLGAYSLGRYLMSARNG